MEKAGWAFLALLLVASQIATLVLFGFRFDREGRIAEINESTALMKNEAAALELDTAKRRNEYYKALGLVMEEIDD